MEYTKIETIELKGRIKEKELQKIIGDNPSMLGIGKVEKLDEERNVGPGRLDLLLENKKGSRYEVEIQLGKTDPSHIIRVIEYWDLERKRYPKYDHTAVIIAENITGRFFNVIGLFNGAIPVIAIQVTAIKKEKGKFGLLFTKILDVKGPGADRDYWIKQGSEETVVLADKVFELIKSLLPKEKIEFNYNKNYIGIGFWVDGEFDNFVKLIPQKKALRISVWLPQSGKMDKALSRFEGRYIKENELYRVKISGEDISDTKGLNLLKSLLRESYKHWYKG